MRALLKVIHKKRGDGTSFIRDAKSPMPHIGHRGEPDDEILPPTGTEDDEPLNFNLLQRLTGAPMGSDKPSAQRLEAILARDARRVEEDRRPPLPDTIIASSQSRADPSMKQSVDPRLSDPMGEIIRHLNTARKSIIDVLEKLGESMQASTLLRQQQTFAVESLWDLNDRILDAGTRAGLETKFMV